MSERSRASLVAVAVVLILALVLGVGIAGKPTSPGPTGGASTGPGGEVTPTATSSGSASQPSSAGSPSEGHPGPVVTWTRLTPEGVAPVARQGASWTMDPGTGIAYLYGGTTSTSTGAAQRGGATLGDLWAYDLAADTWEPVVGTSDEPPPRSGHVAAWVEDVGLVVVGGRGSDGGALGDVWRFDPTTGAWSRIRVAGKTPPARWDACGAAPGDGTLWLTHGTTGRSLLGDTWRLELSAKRWTVVGRPDAPSARSGSACWVDPGGRFVLFGGATSVAQGDLDATTVEVGGGGAWERMAGPGAFPPRSRAASAVHLDRAVIVGGLGADDVVRSDTGELRPTDDTIDPVAADGPTPAARAGAVLVDDPAGERMLLFGGVTADGVSGELWAADLR